MKKEILPYQSNIPWSELLNERLQLFLEDHMLSLCAILLRQDLFAPPLHVVNHKAPVIHKQHKTTTCQVHGSVKTDLAWHTSAVSWHISGQELHTHVGRRNGSSSQTKSNISSFYFLQCLLLTRAFQLVGLVLRGQGFLGDFEVSGKEISPLLMCPQLPVVIFVFVFVLVFVFLFAWKEALHPSHDHSQRSGDHRHAHAKWNEEQNAPSLGRPGVIASDGEDREKSESRDEHRYDTSRNQDHLEEEKKVRLWLEIFLKKKKSRGTWVRAALTSLAELDFRPARSSSARYFLSTQITRPPTLPKDSEETKNSTLQRAYEVVKMAFAA